MKLGFVFTSGFCVTAVSAFVSPRVKVSSTGRLAPLGVATYGGTVDLTDTAQRDVYSMQEWATNCGVQTAQGFELTTQDGEDWSAFTNQNIPQGTPVLFVPADMVLTSSGVEREFGGNLMSAENWLTDYDNGTTQRLPLFRLMVKILAEYQNGANSPFFPWLNALPKRFYNGAAMTDACFECLPPYAAYLSMQERNTFSKFINALRKGFLPIDQQILNDDKIINWAYNVALTRFTEVWSPRREKKIAPMADMLNHGTYPNVVITFDEQGNCLATTTRDVQAGEALTISLGDPSNPTPLFAKYGFLYDDSETIFCKAMHLKDAIDALEYEFKDLLFSVQTGEIAPKVWDIFLYDILVKNDPGNADNFYVACKTNDEATKQGYHDQYFQYTLNALKEHVDTIMYDVDRLTAQAQSYDLATHPRVPVIVQHNNLVRNTFMNVKAQLDAMG